MNKEYEIRILTSPTLEFSSALYILGNNRKNLSLSKEIAFEPDKLLFEMGETAAKLLSKHMQREIYYFMLQDACSMTGMTPLNALPFVAALDNPDINDVPQLIRLLEDNSEQYITYLLAKSAFGSEKDADPNQGIFDDYIHQLPPEEEAFREKLKECAGNPLEVKARLCLVMRQFYELVYKSFEDRIKSIVEAKKPCYQSQFSADPATFINDYLKIDMENYNKKLDIYLSLFFQIGLEFLPSDNGMDTVMLGIHSDKRFGIEVTRNRLKNFYKLLADEKRFKLLELLSQSPKYVNELAELLNLSPPTVSHHLNFFIRAGIVKPSRDEHKLYYVLDHKKVQEYFKRSIKFFAGSDLK